MNVLRHCECCERPQVGGEEWFIGAEGEDICARCAAELLGAERDALRQQLRGAVGDRDWLAGLVYEFLLSGPRKRHQVNEVEMKRLLAIRRLGGQ